MKVCATRTRFRESKVDRGLVATINVLGYENILQILPCYSEGGECIYTIIYKDNEQTQRSVVNAK